eukprot:TRINITY_DN74557_c0_g1_i1.p1 TRINITY_DN74557_c0_g1~~TRINITY_DN74557_c0_g1_i1.p1  ORF type:complete len:871 (-),score=134.56 TRINITY_DN74557_c0_g1_i1:244-2619(-)
MLLARVGAAAKVEAAPTGDSGVATSTSLISPILANGCATGGAPVASGRARYCRRNHSDKIDHGAEGPEEGQFATTGICSGRATWHQRVDSNPACEVTASASADDNMTRWSDASVTSAHTVVRAHSAKLSSAHMFIPGMSSDGPIGMFPVDVGTTAGSSNNAEIRVASATEASQYLAGMQSAATTAAAASAAVAAASAASLVPAGQLPPPVSSSSNVAFTNILSTSATNSRMLQSSSPFRQRDPSISFNNGISSADTSSLQFGCPASTASSMQLPMLPPPPPMAAPATTVYGGGCVPLIVQDVGTWHGVSTAMQGCVGDAIAQPTPSADNSVCRDSRDNSRVSGSLNGGGYGGNAIRGVADNNLLSRGGLSYGGGIVAAPYGSLRCGNGREAQSGGSVCGTPSSGGAVNGGSIVMQSGGDGRVAGNGGVIVRRGGDCRVLRVGGGLSHNGGVGGGLPCVSGCCGSAFVESTAQCHHSLSTRAPSTLLQTTSRTWSESPPRTSPAPLANKFCFATSLPRGRASTVVTPQRRVLSSSVERRRSGPTCGGYVAATTRSTSASSLPTWQHAAPAKFASPSPRLAEVRGVGCFAPSVSVGTATGVSQLARENGSAWSTLASPRRLAANDSARCTVSLSPQRRMSEPLGHRLPTVTTSDSANSLGFASHAAASATGDAARSTPTTTPFGSFVLLRSEASSRPSSPLVLPFSATCGNVQSSLRSGVQTTSQVVRWPSAPTGRSTPAFSTSVATPPTTASSVRDIAPRLSQVSVDRGRSQDVRVAHIDTPASSFARLLRN